MKNHHLIILIISVFFTFNASSQTDTVSITVNVQHDTLNNTDIAFANFVFDNLSNIGGLDVIITSIGSDQIIGEYHYLRPELDSLGYLYTDKIKMPVFSPVTGDSYRIEVTPSDLNGVYLPIVYLEQSY